MNEFLVKISPKILIDTSKITGNLGTKSCKKLHSRYVWSSIYMTQVIYLSLCVYVSHIPRKHLGKFILSEVQAEMIIFFTQAVHTKSDLEKGLWTQIQLSLLLIKSATYFFQISTQPKKDTEALRTILISLILKAVAPDGRRTQKCWIHSSTKSKAFWKVAQPLSKALSVLQSFFCRGSKEVK